jgi:hypothetical protein
MTHEEGDTPHGWLIAYGVATLQRTAAWCTTPNGAGAGIWQAGQGPAADERGDVYVMTGNYGVEDAAKNAVEPATGDLPQSLIKLLYTPPAGGAAGKLEAVAWFQPFQDHARNKNGADNFQDYDSGSAGPLPLPGMDLVTSDIPRARDARTAVLFGAADRIYTYFSIERRACRAAQQRSVHVCYRVLTLVTTPGKQHVHLWKPTGP